MTTATSPAVIRPRPIQPFTLAQVSIDTLERHIRGAAAELASRGSAERQRLIEILTSELEDATTAQRLSQGHTPL